MSPEIVGLIGIGIMLILMFLEMNIGLAMAFAGFAGTIYLFGPGKAMAMLSTVPYSSVASYMTSALPMFLFMGAIVTNTGVGADLYQTGYKLLGQLRGGLGMATVIACGGFAAICGSSMATAVTIGKVALPEMQKYKYNPRLAAGVVAAGGTLGILIPPSLGFILYAILTQQSIAKLFMAGLLPGILQVILYIVLVFVLCRIYPSLGPSGPTTTTKEKIVSLKYTWTVVVLFVVVIGGIYGGVFTATEAGAVGVFGALLISFFSRKLTAKNLRAAVLQTGETTAMLLMILVGGFILNYFMAASGAPAAIGTFITSLHLSKYAILAAIIVMYLILGMFMDANGALVLTTPVIFPVIMELGFDPIWYGVIMVRLIEIGMITPPVGMNVFALAGVSGIPMGTIFRGILPFICADIVHVAILVAFPAISLLLPSLTK
jgi:C4-dicarboxylate transporter, DctM subunit